jgi:hypothetical protein
VAVETFLVTICQILKISVWYEGVITNTVIISQMKELRVVEIRRRYQAIAEKGWLPNREVRRGLLEK